MNRNSLLKIGIAIGVSLSIAACSSHNNSSAPAPVVVAPQSFEARFGTTFAAAYDTDRNGNAIDPTNSDVPALNLSAEPIDN